MISGQFREMAKFRAEMEILWEEAFCRVHDREIEAAAEEFVSEMAGEGAQNMRKQIIFYL